MRRSKWIVGFVGSVAVLVAGLGLSAAPASAGTTTLSGVEQLAAGRSMSCAVLADTTARCWGSGPLGTGAFGAVSSVAVVVQNAVGDPLTGIEQIAIGSGHVCALMTDTSAVCWGQNLTGEIGDGTTQPRPRPVAVQQQGGTPLTGITQLSLGDMHSCALLASGQARCWGQNMGTIGDGTRTNRKRAVLVQNGTGTGPLTGIVQLAAGSQHTCALLSGHTVRCFGENGQGQIGDGTTTARLLPKLVKATSGSGSLTDVTQISSRLQTTCARLSTGQLRCWGPNSVGQRGNGTVTLPGQPGPLLPTVVKAPSGTTAFTGAQSVGVGAFHACARINTAQLRCWGANTDGQAGDGTRSTTPKKLPVVVRNQFDTQALSNARTVVGAAQHTCALLTDSTVQCWGANNFGQVGDGTTTRRKLPTPVLTA